MTSYIYTISHPLTNQIVYVGCTRLFDKRVKQHIWSKTSSKISEYIQSLRQNYLLPKIEIIDEVTEDVYETEMFWIRLMKSWGFDLLNQYKVIPPVNNQYTSIKSSYTGCPKQKKSRSWSKDDIYVGKEYLIEHVKKNSFRTIFVGKMKEYDLSYFLRFEDL